VIMPVAQHPMTSPLPPSVDQSVRRCPSSCGSAGKEGSAPQAREVPVTWAAGILDVGSIPPTRGPRAAAVDTNGSLA